MLHSSTTKPCLEDAAIFPPLINIASPTPVTNTTAAVAAVAAATDIFFDSGGPAFHHLLSPSPPYSPTLSSYCFHRSSSSHSLPLYLDHSNRHGQPPLLSTPPAPTSSYPHCSSGDFLDSSTGPVRRILSTGDLQGLTKAEQRNQEIAAIAAKATRYSSEARKERIERYRRKRNQRNFQKKITYACRKTLADSRPRVRGRFARNGEAEAGATMEADTFHELYSYPTQSSTGGRGESERWLTQMQAAALEVECFNEAEEEEDVGATFFDVLFMNTLT